MLKVCHSWRFRFVPNLLFKGSNLSIGRSSILSNCLNILIWIFQGFSLFSYQCSFVSPCLTATWLSYQILSCLSTTFFIFRYLAPSPATNFDILSYHFLFVNNFLSAFSASEFYNSMYLSNQLMYNSTPYHPCQQLFTIVLLNPSKTKRRGWDSNPRALADKRFSRPPRYDHFDTSPY